MVRLSLKKQIKLLHEQFALKLLIVLVYKGTKKKTLQKQGLRLIQINRSRSKLFIKNI